MLEPSKPCVWTALSLCTTKRLTASELAKGRLLPCNSRPFATQNTAFRSSSAIRLDEIIVSSFVFVITFRVHILLQSRQSVTVIPRYDAESSVYSQYRLKSWMFSIFRVVARNDGYRLPGLYQDVAISKKDKRRNKCFIQSKQTADAPVAVHPASRPERQLSKINSRWWQRYKYMQ